MQRVTANGWFDSAVKAGRLASVTARATLYSDRKAGKNYSSDNQIETCVEEAEDVGTAQYMVRNMPNNATVQAIDNQITQLEHPLGRSFIRDLEGNDINLRPNAASQRVRNNKLCDVEVIDLDSKPSSSKCSSVTVDRTSCEEMEDRTQRLKAKAMNDIRNGTPNTKILGKKLFREYQSMSRDPIRYEDQMEMASMFNVDSSVRKKNLDSIEAHYTFKSIEK